MIGSLPIVADSRLADLQNWIEKGQIEIVSGASKRDASQKAPKASNPRVGQRVSQI